MAKYWKSNRCTGALQSVVSDMLRRDRASPNCPVANTTLSYDQLEQIELGLRFDHETPSVPYLCLQAWLLHMKSSDSPVLPTLRATIRSPRDGPVYTWQHFESFCAQYLALRIAAWAPERKVLLKNLLRGAKFDTQPHLVLGIPALNKHKGGVWQAGRRFPKNRTLADNGKPIPWKSSGQVVLNKEGAPFDLFVSLDNGTKHGFVICGQVKHDKVTQEVLDDECRNVKKAMKKANLKHWMLLVFSTDTLEDSVDIPDRCAVVASPQFESFFGRPFAERVHFWSTETININTAPQWALQRVQGVDKHTAQLIVTERHVRPFSDKEDARNRLGLADTKLNRELLNILTF